MRRKILLCLIIVTGVILFDDVGSGLCKTSPNWTIHAEVTDSGGGECGSNNYNLCFSLGQTSPVGVCASDSQCLSAGFITGMAKQVQAADVSTDSSSGSNSSCFILTLNSY